MRISDLRSRLPGRGRAARGASGRTQAPPPSTGPDEETVRIAHKDFRKRRLAGRWHRVRALVLAVLALPSARRRHAEAVAAGIDDLPPEPEELHLPGLHHDGQRR